MSRDGEVWRPVRGWPYAVSSHGRVRRSDGHQGRIGEEAIRRSSPWGNTKSSTDTRYQRVGMSRDGEPRVEAVHRLVMEAFVGPCPEGYEVHHENHRRDDNRLENLRYLKRRRNRTLRGTKNPSAKLTPDDVREIRRLHETGKYSNGDIAKRFGMGRTAIRYIVNGVRWKHVA